MTATDSRVRSVRSWGAGTCAVVRLLIALDQPITGMAIAREVGVTQPRVSQVLAQLSDKGAVTASPRGYTGDPARLLVLYQAHAKPHLAEPQSYWYSTRPLMDQARRVLDTAKMSQVRIAFSADLGPDLLTPWRHPTLTIVYSDGPIPLEESGMVPAVGRADASLVLRITKEPANLSATPPWCADAEGLPMADPAQQWWDLKDLGGEDRDEAADRLRQSIIDRALPRIPPSVEQSDHGPSASITRDWM
ncbi:winged helix-turn-helix domain-containing protein [Candidatus Microthrix sp.]|jgi:DNA-binding transcriptional ArsR family regulator|uniref:Winged helix-turn-helix transcriptional regulator n=1 Tax=Candidatus Neomicrothrix subdominans TaxID=2954438 RepID=A0A936N9V4_9ACTN|nr:winged helix-turn-helix domain-containing protein [Candidatus Microthrix sp.]MBK9295764.1 winged helix-turn-helix transcriptional regulator [Candidatus Microthrix subdominans]HMS47413.1 winged helix-turn-helix domain-containing protein [Candidatus Microthrix sp.]